MKIRHTCHVALLAGAASFGMTLSPNIAEAGCGDYPGASVDWSGCRKRSVILSGNDFSGANFSKTDFFGSDLRDTKATGADFSKAQITRMNISNSEMTGANLSKVEGTRVQFEKSVLQGASLEKAAMFRSNFAGADLSGANVNKAELGRADFTGANLTGAQITFTNLARAKFTGSTVDDADLMNSWTYLTRFEGVDLGSVKNLTQGQLDLACGDNNTVLPTGLTAPASWPCAEAD